jgi:hypothetical protein
MLASPEDVRTIIEMLGDIHKTQGKHLSMIHDQGRSVMYFGASVNDLTGGLEALAEAIPTSSTDPQLAGLRTDVCEFKLDVIALRKDLGEIHGFLSKLEIGMAEIKLTLDIMLSQIGDPARTP